MLEVSIVPNKKVPEDKALIAAGKNTLCASDSAERGRQ